MPNERRHETRERMLLLKAAAIVEGDKNQMAGKKYLKESISFFGRSELTANGKVANRPTVRSLFD